jgi:hypothetical protein
MAWNYTNNTYTPVSGEAGLTLNSKLGAVASKIKPIWLPYLCFRLFCLASSANTAYIQLARLELFDNDGIFSPLNLTGYTGDGFTVSVSGIYGAGNEGWRAFTNVLTGMWVSNAAGSSWLKLQCPTARAITGYRVTIPAGAGPSRIGAWILQGSNTGAFTGEQVDLDSKTKLWTPSANESLLVTL